MDWLTGRDFRASEKQPGPATAVAALQGASRAERQQHPLTRGKGR